jgi:RNA 2',3'-cyclic 3'-phosphodiesterase
MRLFVSIDFPEEIRNELHSRLPVLNGWKLTQAGQIHLTLFFVGDCSREEYTEISGRLSQITFQPFELQIGGLGVFPSRRNPRVLWYGAQKEPALIDLQQQIFEKLEPFNKKPLRKKFIPHITVGRRKFKNGSDRQINDLLDTEFPAIQTVADTFSLKQSTLKPKGSEHTILKTFKAGF